MGYHSDPNPLKDPAIFDEHCYGRIYKLSGKKPMGFCGQGNWVRFSVTSGTHDHLAGGGFFIFAYMHPFWSPFALFRNNAPIEDELSHGSRFLDGKHMCTSEVTKYRAVKVPVRGDKILSPVLPDSFSERTGFHLDISTKNSSYHIRNCMTESQLEVLVMLRQNEAARAAATEE